jgi:hypothetical protein
MDDEYDEEDPPAVKADVIDFVILGVATLQQFAETIAKALDKVTYLLVAHANYKYDQTQFADRVRGELEGLPTTEE